MTNTETNTETNDTANPVVAEDIVKRDIMRELPCKLTDEQLLEVAINKAEAEAALEELESDFKDVKEEWSVRIAQSEKRIAEMGAELRTKEQKRVIKCYERFVAGTIEVVRSDTKEVVERRAANLSEAQRALPATDAKADAAKVQRDNGVAENDEGDVVPPEGDGKRNGKNKRK